MTITAKEILCQENGSLFCWKSDKNTKVNKTVKISLSNYQDQNPVAFY
jgi:hypothetical protein